MKRTTTPRPSRCTLGRTRSMVSGAASIATWFGLAAWRALILSVPRLCDR